MEKLPGDLAETMLGGDVPPAAQEPPRLLVIVSGAEAQVYTLEEARYRLGRSAENEIRLPSPVVSGQHAVLQANPQGFELQPLPQATNPIIFRGLPLEGPQQLHHGDVLRIGTTDPALMVVLTFHWPAEAFLPGQVERFDFGAANRLQIGREASNDVVLDAPTISRFHAVVEKIGPRYRVQDLDSSNGTFVNGERVRGQTMAAESDTLQVGPYRFVLEAGQIAQYAEAGGMRVEALGLNKWVRPDLNLLKDLSLLFQPREFVVVVGQSGGGKSTLLDAIAGIRPATHGQVLVNDVNIYQHFDTIRNEIGYVPQKDIIHMELTAYQSLDYAARLRMPADTTPQEREKRVMEVLADLDLTHRKDVQISGLSGGQQKRVSIGVELLTKPGLFFLDEPSSGLDPGTESALMHLMRRLADQGRTIVLITHATKNAVLADKVVFLARGGFLAWFGPPDEALAYFDQYRPERDRRARTMDFDEIYTILDDPERGSAEEWADRYRQHRAYQEHILQPLAARGRPIGEGVPSAAAGPGVTIPGADSKTTAAPRSGRSRVSGFRQFRILSERNVKILTRDRASLVLMLASAPIVALLDVLLAFVLGRDLYSFANGDMANALTSLFQPIIFAIMVGGLAQMREFVKESEIYRRERLVNLKVLPYVMSKIWVAALLALYQAAAYTLIHYLAFNMPGGVVEFGLFYLTLVLATLAGMMLGLFASAIAPNANAAPLIVILLIIPQVVLGGALIPMPDPVSAPMASRWAFESLVATTGIGSDVAADLCWELPEELRNEMDLDEKAAAGCNCMGLSALDENSCNFPGLGAYYDPAIDAPAPVEPPGIGEPPAEPEIPPPPPEPQDQTDPVAVAEYLNALGAYSDQVEAIQDDFRGEMQDYQAQAEIFQAEMVVYMEDRARWEVERNAPVTTAEAVIGQFNENFGWSFVNKEDSQAYWSRLALSWGVLAGQIGLLFLAILFVIARKDRAR
jgi:ABC-type multidrug transport system ATPase subunit